MKIKASTMIEILVVMIISGIVIGLTFEGMDIFRRFSRKVTGEITKNSDMLNMYLSLETVIGKSDSLNIKYDSVSLYRKGSVIGKIYSENSSLFIEFQNNVDSIPTVVTSLEVVKGNICDTLFIDTKTISLMFNTKERPIISTVKNKYYENEAD